MNLNGVFPPIPTPFEQDAVDHRALAGNVDRWMRTRLTGLVVLGSNAEAPLLEDAEADAIIDTARQHVPRDRTLIGGVGLVRTPSFYKNVMSTRTSSG